jgi:LysR family transcriptional regulator, nod-box dependent transcriptional activator
MHFRGLDLNLLVALDALITEKNISRTGERIHLSQSATSGVLARLREYFNDELLVPVGRKMMLTPLAEELAWPIGELLRQAEGIMHRNPVFVAAESKREFRVIMSDYVATVLMSRALPILEQQAPHVAIHLIIGTRYDTLLERGEADLVILPQQYLASGHPTEDLFSDRFACLVCASNAEVQKGLSLKTYQRLRHVVVNFGEHYDQPGFEQRFLEEAGIHRDIAVTVPTFALVPQLVMGTNRVATIHRRLAAYYARHLPLRVLKPPIEFPLLKEAMQWHTYRDSDPGLRWLRGIFKAGMLTSESRRFV